MSEMDKMCLYYFIQDINKYSMQVFAATKIYRRCTL